MLGAVLLIVAAAGADGAPESYSLRNGLRVVLERQATFPTVAVHVIYGVGSADDPPAAAGLAHLVEHLACEKTEHISRASVMQQLAWRGATLMNATTMPDSTSYFETVPASELDAALWVESDRMGFLVGGLTGDSVRHERLIVAQESAHREVFVDDRATQERLWKALFSSGHPYARAFATQVGDVSDKEITAFIERFYGPRNAVLVLVGDLPADIKQRVEKYFGDLPARGGVARPPGAAAVAIRVNDFVGGEAPRYTMAWALPAQSERARLVGQVVVQLLVGEREQVDASRAADADIRAQLVSLQRASLLLLEARGMAAEGQELGAKLIAKLHALRGALDDRRLAQARRSVRIESLVGRQRFEDRARIYALETLQQSETPAENPADPVTTDEVHRYIDGLLTAPVAPR